MRTYARSILPFHPKSGANSKRLSPPFPSWAIATMPNSSGRWDANAMMYAYEKDIHSSISLLLFHPFLLDKTNLSISIKNHFSSFIIFLHL